MIGKTQGGSQQEKNISQMFNHILPYFAHYLHGNNFLKLDMKENTRTFSTKD